jgi:LysR family transcriptional activator of mexEF-oprN operon
MNDSYGRDLDLNLLRVFAVVASSGSVTQASTRLYLTQPAVSAALRRLSTAVGAPLFVRQGRGLALTSRGQRLRTQIEPHLSALVDAALSPPTFDPRSNQRTFRLGLADSAELWLLPPLLRVLGKEAPHMRVIALPVQFRSVAALLGAGVDAAVTVADELPAGVRRQPLFQSSFVCLFDPRHVQLGRRPTEKQYFAHDHVIVSYNGDLRGVVEDVLGKQRNVRCSVSSFANLGAVIDGSALLATVPGLVARQIRSVRPRLRSCALPASFAVKGSAIELLWPAAAEDDPAGQFLRGHIVRIAARTAGAMPALPSLRSGRGGG